MTESKMTVRDFIGLSAKERTELLATAPITIAMEKRAPNHRTEIRITATERDNSAISIKAAIAYQGFSKMIPDAADTVVLNDPATKDKSFKFGWV
jgi:hypothetical protein